MNYAEERLSLTPQNRSATLTADWFAHQNNPMSPPRPAGNFVTPLICGEEAFAKLYQCLLEAKQSIELISWGFDPSMRLKRSDAKGLSLGDLLKRKAEEGVQVRVLIWNNRLAQLAENSVIGEGVFGSGGATTLGSGMSEGQSASSAANAPAKRQKLQLAQAKKRQELASLGPADEVKRRAIRDELIDIEQQLGALDSGYVKGSDSGGTLNEPEIQIQTRNWHRWAQSGQARNIEFRTRDFDMLVELTYSDDAGLKLHRGRLAILARLMAGEAPDLTFKQVLALSLFPSHHQKTVLIDYLTPARAQGFVMGHNLQRNYWDSSAHHYDDQAAGRDLGFGPWQDLSVHVRGPVLFDLNHNFCSAWDKGSSWFKRIFNGSLAGQRTEKIASSLVFIENGGEAAQICRTQPEEGPETTILEIYRKALGNVRQYAYIENQYFRYKALAEHLKEHAARYKAAGGKQLHLFVVTNNPESAHFASSTYAMLDNLGQGELLPLAHRDLLYDQRQLVYRERELLAQPASPGRDSELAKTRSQMHVQNIDPQRADELLALDPNAHYNKAAARDLEPPLLPLTGLKVIIATLVSTAPADKVPAKEQGSRRVDQQISAEVGQEKGTAQYKAIYVHSKLLLVDDVFFTLGSANINARSLHSDSELNIAMTSPKTTRTWRERLWAMHSGQAISTVESTAYENIQKDFKRWEEVVDTNWKNQRKHLPLKGNLVRFWDVVTPYAQAVD